MYEGLSKFDDFFILSETLIEADPSWFGFIITIKENAPFNREEIIDYLEYRRIATRLLFGGNITRQPAYLDVKYRICRELVNTDIVMNRSFWIGVYPEMTQEILSYIISCFEHFCLKKDYE